MPRSRNRAGACVNVARETLNAMCSTQPTSRGAGRPASSPGLVGEHREQAAVPGIEVEVVLVGLAQVGLLEDERHAERALPEVDRALPASIRRS